MYPPDILKAILAEHRASVPLMVETLLDLEVPAEDALLLGKLPWQFLANRIAVEREHLGFAPVLPLLHFKPSPPPPVWLTPAMIVKMFELALESLGEPPLGAEIDEDNEDDHPNGRRLVLPA